MIALYSDGVCSPHATRTRGLKFEIPEEGHRAHGIHVLRIRAVHVRNENHIGIESLENLDDDRAERGRVRRTVCVSPVANRLARGNGHEGSTWREPVVGEQSVARGCGRKHDGRVRDEFNLFRWKTEVPRRVFVGEAFADGDDTGVPCDSQEGVNLLRTLKGSNRLSGQRDGNASVDCKLERR